MMSLATVRSAKKRTLARRLLFWFLLIALLPCGVLTAITGQLANKALKNTVRERLIQIASARAIQLEAYALERVQDGATLARSPTFIEALKLLSAVTTASPTETRSLLLQNASPYEDFFNYITASFGYDSLLLIDVNGRVVYSQIADIPVETSLTTGSYANAEIGKGFDRSRTLLQSDLGRFELIGKSLKPISFITAPIFSNEMVIGVLALGLGPDHVWKVLSDTTGLGTTGEVLAAERIEQTVRITSPLRHKLDAAFRLTIPLTDEDARGARLASSGSRGDGQFPDYRGEQVAAAWCYLPSYRWGLVVKQDATEAFALVSLQRTALISLLVITGCIVAMVALFVARSISNPINHAIELARRVAAGDLSTTIQIETRGETALLLDALQTMTTDLHSLISGVQLATDAVAGTASTLQSTGERQEKVVTHLGQSTSQTVAAVEEISVTGKELANTMNLVNEMAVQAGEKAIEGRESLVNMDGTMRKLAESTASFGARLTIINERASTINLAVTTITKVADQTNLLSINAAIEAEKAGEYGTGFLVIAREIRRLADQTAVASLEIEQVVKDMQLSVSSGVMEMDAFTKSVDTGVIEIGSISQQLAEIISSVKGITEKFQLVAEGTQSQSQGAEQIREAMCLVADEASQSEQALDAFRNATTALHKAAEELKGEITRFTV